MYKSQLSLLSKGTHFFQQQHHKTTTKKHKSHLVRVAVECVSDFKTFAVLILLLLSLILNKPNN